MNGKIVGSFIVISALVFGAVVYWAQEYAYYDQVSAPEAAITAVSVATGAPEPLPISDFEGIDGSSSPIRFRACFHADQDLATLTETYQIYPEATPLNGPKWFTCYNAAAIGGALERGEAVAFLARRNIAPGVDRVIAVFPDGRAYAWHQLNETYQD